MSEPLGPSVSFSVPGLPIGKKLQVGNKKIRNSDKTVAYQQLVRTIAKLNRPPEPWTGAIEVTITYYLSPPIHWSHKRRQRALDGEIYCTLKPDVDNVSKVILDAMSKVIYKDDAQVVDEHIIKSWDNEPSSHIVVRALEWKPTQVRLI